MKKMLLFVVAMFTAATSFAQSYEIEDPTWTKTISDAVADPKDVNVYAPVVITSQGDVVKTGTFTQAFEFAGKELEPVAKSSYIVKYDKKGNEIWANSLQGAATVTAITADEGGNIYVAGVFADKVIITSTDGQNVEINGMEDMTEQVSSFIAIYDTEGKLKTSRQFVPEADFMLFMTALENEAFYTCEGVFRINKIALGNDKIYLTANYKGMNDIDGTELNGKVLNYFDYMYIDLNGFAAIQLDKDLTNAKVLADVHTTESSLYGDLQMEPQAMKLAVDGDNVFVAWIGWGNLTMVTENESRDYDFTVTDDAQEHGFVVYNLTDDQAEVYHAPAVDAVANFFTIFDMQLKGEKLYISGTYIGSMAFDNDQTSTGACDGYLAAINTNDLTVDWAVTSGIDEGDATKNNEMVVGMEVSDMFGTMIINSIDMGTKEVLLSNVFINDPIGKQISVIPVPFTVTYATSSIAGSAINSNVGTESTLSYFTDEEFVQGVENIENGTLNIGNGAVYNLQGQRVNKAQKGVFIQNGKKVVVK